MIRTLVQLRGLSKVSSLLLSTPARGPRDVLTQFQNCSALRFSTIVPTFNEEKSLETAEEFMRKHEISVSDKAAPAPCLSFQQSGLPEYLLNNLTQEFTSPTPIQAQALPIALSGKNMVGIGQTGSGKTLAFLLPAFMHIKSERERLGKVSGKVSGKAGGPLVLVLAPTRELAKQTEEVALKYRRVTGIKTVCCIGGEGRSVKTKQILSKIKDCKDIFSLYNPAGPVS